MKLVPTDPGAIVHFSYDAVSRTLSAHLSNGQLMICSDVPEAMYNVLEKTPAPEVFFASYITPKFACRMLANGR